MRWISPRFSLRFLLLAVTALAITLGLSLLRRQYVLGEISRLERGGALRLDRTDFSHAFDFDGSAFTQS